MVIFSFDKCLLYVSPKQYAMKNMQNLPVKKATTLVWLGFSINTCEIPCNTKEVYLKSFVVEVRS